jgi:hypothetical protein
MLCSTAPVNETNSPTYVSGRAASVLAATGTSAFVGVPGGGGTGAGGGWGAGAPGCCGGGCC